MQRRVEAIGESVDPILAFVGEAPGEKEEEQGQPFVGRAGKVLRTAVNEAYKKVGREFIGLETECYITNVYKYRPPKNDFKKLLYDKKEPTPQLKQAWNEVNEEILSVNPKVIVCLGEEPTKAFKETHTIPAGITSYRGSVFEFRNIPTVATVHPAAVLRQWQLFPLLVADITKALNIAIHGRRPRVDVTILRDTKQALSVIEQMKRQPLVAFDVETENRQISCISLCCNETQTFCIPFWFGNSGSLFSKEGEIAIWKKLLELFTRRPNQVFAAHNACFDLQALAVYNNGRIPNIDVYDTMTAFHTLNLELPASLDSASSIYTHLEYYKFLRKTDSMERFFEYNALDSYACYILAVETQKDLEKEGLVEFYNKFVRPLSKTFAHIEIRGVNFDKKKRSELKKQKEEQIAKIERSIKKIIGKEINLRSPKQLQEVIYNELGYKPVYKRRSKTEDKSTISVDEDTLVTLNQKKPHPFLEAVLEYRKEFKIKSTYLDVELDPDGRLRCSYNLAGTCTGRLSSSKTVYGTGTNLQNLPNNEIRSLIIPDAGKTLINIDLSQAEARVVAYVSGDDRLIRVFESGGDIHTRNAALIFNKPEDRVTKEERNLAKRTVHGANYGIGPRTFAHSVGISERDAKRLLNQYFATFPRVALWQNLIKKTILETRYLKTPLGRDRYFTSQWSSSLIKEGLAFIPQSTVADILNLFLIDLHNRGFEILLQVHDSILLQVDDRKVDSSIKFIDEIYKKNYTFLWKDMCEGRLRQAFIPIDFKVGKDFYNFESQYGKISNLDAFWICPKCLERLKKKIENAKTNIQDPE